MSLSTSSQDESTSSSINIQTTQIERPNSHSSDDGESLDEQSSVNPGINVSTHLSNFSNEHHQRKGLNNNDQDIELIKQTNTLSYDNQTAKNRIEKPHSSEQSVGKNEGLLNEQYEQLNIIIENTAEMERLSQQNPNSNDDLTSVRSPETSEVIILTTAVSLKDLLSYQDVMNAIEREFHLHAGQEREIIMKLWLKGQTMLSILQRFRYLLQDLNIDDKDFMNGLKQIRELINYTDRDVQYFREQTTMLENQNHFLESEFQRQLDRIVQEKNEQISRLIHIIDKTCSPPSEFQGQINEIKHSSGTEELLKKFMQQNVELQREIEILRAKLEYTFTFVNDKFDQQKSTTSSVSTIQTAFEQIRQTERKLQELKLKSTSQQEENDLLKYLIEKSQKTSDIEQRQLFRTVEQHSLEREIDRVRRELEITEKRTIQLEQRFENSDETTKFHIEKMKLKCDVLRKHIDTCTQRLDEINRQNSIDLQNENQIQKNKKHQEESNNARKVIQLENELLKLRERYNELIEHSNTLKSELNNLRKQSHEREKLESSSNSDLEKERRHANQLENELKTLRIKYEDVCERVGTATHQLEHVKVVLQETSRRCEQLEKEKSEINAQSENLSQNVANVTAKYKDKLNTIKSRLEQTEREKREAQNRSEQLQNEIERLKDELTYKKEMIYEKEKLIQDAQYKNREILLERQSVEDRISNEYKRINELIDKNRLLEEEIDRMRRNQITENLTHRRTEGDLTTTNSSKQIDELRLKIDEFEKRFVEDTVSRESLQVQIKILEEENIDLRDIMNQMRKRAQDGRKEERDRNNEIQQLIARTEFNARQYMTNFNLTTLPSSSTLVRIVPLSSPTKIS